MAAAVVGPSPYVDPPNFRTPVLDGANKFTPPWQKEISQIVDGINARSATFFGSHADRAILTVQQAPEGTFYWEDDRNALYIATNPGTVLEPGQLATWVYVGGFTEGFWNNAPSDLGVADFGFTYRELLTNHLVYWTGSAWLFVSGDSGGSYIVAFGSGLTPQVGVQAGWSACDGSDTTYLTVGAPTLSLTTFTTPSIAGSYFRR